jgi:PIN domain nuclease of toxin-antitoxin system
MKSIDYVTDTHPLVWYFTVSPRLSKRALNVFEKTVEEGVIFIPTVVLAEIMYISKKGRIPISFSETVEKIVHSDNYEITPLDLDILNIADKIDYDMEMHDRIIVATAIFYDVPVITKDEVIKKSGKCHVIW